MVKYDTVLVRFGELSTKGKNRRDFIKQLDQNIRYILKDHTELKFERTHDRIYIHLHEEPLPEIEEKLKKVFGISSFSFTKKVETDIDKITETAFEIAQDVAKKTFKIQTKRHDKSYPMKSDDINRYVASHILKNSDYKVDVHQPELLIQIEVHKQSTYITSQKIHGAGGYPTGINGKCLLLLSGGIDSPVAAYEIMKRGIEVEAVHFASPPYTSQQAQQKVIDLATKASIYQKKMKVHIVNFTDLQLAIYQNVPESYAITIMRRMMYRLAEKIAKKRGCLAIGTGESVGQVASQTLESMGCINQVISMPVLRPLVCQDKVEIIDLARKIDTYETSILPFEDCCTIFDPKNPVTKPLLEKCEQYEARFDYQPLLENCIDTMNTVEANYEKKEEDYL